MQPYDRTRDFVSFDNSNKTYDFPSKEIYVFLNPDENRWYFELIDNKAFSLKVLNDRAGTLHKTNLTNSWHCYAVELYLQKRFPDAMIGVYEKMQDWITDHELGCIF